MSCSFDSRARTQLAPLTSGGQALVIQQIRGLLRRASDAALSTCNNWAAPNARRARDIRTALTFCYRPLLRPRNHCFEEATSAESGHLYTCTQGAPGRFGDGSHFCHSRGDYIGRSASRTRSILLACSRVLPGRVLARRAWKNGGVGELFEKFGMPAELAGGRRVQSIVGTKFRGPPRCEFVVRH
jgi:hypothetical protein